MGETNVSLSKGSDISAREVASSEGVSLKAPSRRGFFKTGLAATGLLVATRALAELCGVKTGDQPEGPFFPKPGTPVDPVRENPDNSVPIFLANDNDLTVIKGRDGVATGQVIYIRGKITDASTCAPIAGTTVIIWQATASGRYNHKDDVDAQDFTHPKTGKVIHRTIDHFFQGWGRAVSDANGDFWFKTIVPGFYPADLKTAWYRPPHVHFMVSATGYPQFVTQMYFKGAAIVDNEFTQELNAKDPLLQSTSITPEQREKLVVEFAADQSGTTTDGLVGRFDIAMTK